jgi:tRNA threonylcarbamoyladenosine biosynthesis protein TsaB
MIVLSIDTCGATGSVTLARLEPFSPNSEQLTLLAETELPGKTYSAQLLPAIRQHLAAHNATVAQIATIVVTNGPGSFTGIRIGLATTKGLAEVHATPIVAVSRLAVLAHKAGTHAAALDASRGEFYFGHYSGPTPTSGAPNELVRWSGKESLVARDQLQQQASTLAHSLAICEPSAHALAPLATLVAPPTAADSLRFSLPRLLAQDYDNPVTLDGNYLRRSDAEIFSKPQSSTAPAP